MQPETDADRVLYLRAAVRECLRDAESRRDGISTGNSSHPDTLTALILGLRETLRRTGGDRAA